MPNYHNVFGTTIVIGGQLTTTHLTTNDQGRVTTAVQTTGLLVDLVTVCKG